MHTTLIFHGQFIISILPFQTTFKVNIDQCRLCGQERAVDKGPKHRRPIPKEAHSHQIQILAGDMYLHKCNNNNNNNARIFIALNFVLTHKF